jgi:hypothetical protein
MFGYYLIEEVNDNGVVKDKYLQIRYFLPLKVKSANLPLSVNENPEDMATAHMKYVEAVDEDELLKQIVWMEQTEEYKAVKKFFNL